MAFPLYTRNPTATVTDLTGAGQPLGLAGWDMASTNAADAYVQIFFNKASAITIGTTVPDLVVMINKTTGRATSSLSFKLNSEKGVSFAVTTTENGSTAMTYGNSIIVTFFVD